MKSLMSIIVVGALAPHAFAQPAPAPGPAPTHDDLSKAADATAEIATVEPTALKASSDDIDLSSLGLDPGGSAFDDKLNIYGYADIAYRGEHAFENSKFFPAVHGFAFGNLNIYMAKNLTQKARTLLEVQYTFLPNGTTGATGTVNTTVADPANDSIPTKWGSIVIQRAYLEYDVTEYLTIRAGHWLTPYGIWNTDHGSPTIITVSRPYLVDAGFFPERQTGLDLFGSRHVSDFKLSYHLTVSNGRSETEAQIDKDKELAFGGRLEADTPWGVRVGASYYRGRYTGNAPPVAGATAPTFREAAYGVDAQFDLGGLHVQGEAALRDRSYATLMEAMAATGGAATSPDVRDTGLYVLAGYRFDQLWNVMPFAYGQRFTRADHTYFESATTGSLGLNFRPTASMVFKIQYQLSKLADGDGLLAGTVDSKYFAQAAWVF